METAGVRYLRGQVWFAKYGRITDGNVQAGDRPVVIISNNTGNAFSGVLTVIPITTSMSKAQLPTHVKYMYNDKLQTVLCEQIRTSSINSMMDYKYTLSDELMEKIEQATMVHLGLTLKMPSLDKLEKLIAKIAEQKSNSVKKSEVDDDFVLKVAESLSNIFDIQEQKKLTESSEAKAKKEAKPKIESKKVSKDDYFKVFEQILSGREEGLQLTEIRSKYQVLQNTNISQGTIYNFLKKAVDERLAVKDNNKHYKWIAKSTSEAV